MKTISIEVELLWLNLDGDRQADLSVHGEPTKAAYAYPSEHYEFWRSEFPDLELAYGLFGENFTTEGMLEGEVHVGDSFRIGGAEVMATTPRVPCYKLGCYKIGINFGRADVFKRLLLSRRSGFSFAVLREGAVRPGGAIERLARGEARVSVADVNRLYAF